jgi:tetratricopeptide (TPR) repeat protein
MLRPALVLTLMLVMPPPRAGLPKADPAEVEVLCRRAAALRYQAHYREAEVLLGRALALAEQGRPECDQRIAVWNELGVLYKSMGRFDEASEVYGRSLTLAGKQARHADDAVMATLYHNLGGLEHARERYAAGEPLARRAVAIRERLLGPDHPEVAKDLAALAALLDGQGKRQEAAASLIRALGILERTYGPDDYEVAVSLNNLAALRYAEGDRAEALRLYRRALAIKEERLGPDHPDVATTLNNMAVLQKAQGDRREAAKLYGRALGIFEKSLGAEHPKTIACRDNYARLRER